MRLAPYEFSGGVAVVTGAASGIGEQLCRLLAVRGSDVIMVDRDEPKLAAVAVGIRATSRDVSVETVVADLADPAAVTRLATDLARRHPRITLLINNAGVALGGRFDQISLEEFEWVLQVNFRAAVALTHGLLPTLAAPGGHLVNVSSIFGLVAPPTQSAYVASKFALRGFSEVLRLELASSGIGVTTVLPAGVRTRIAESARRGQRVSPEQFEDGRARLTPMLKLSPEEAASRILSAVRRRRARQLITPEAYGLDLAARIAPVGHGTVMARLFLLASRRSRRDP